MPDEPGRSSRSDGDDHSVSAGLSSAGFVMSTGVESPVGPLTLVADGRTNRQVGSELFISEKTVSVHLSRVMAKLGAGGRAEAVSIAFRRGLLAPGEPGGPGR